MQFSQTGLGPITKHGATLQKIDKNLLLSLLHFANSSIVVRSRKYAEVAILEALDRGGPGLGVYQSLLAERHPVG